jgi:hypothetical protein
MMQTLLSQEWTVDGKVFEGKVQHSERELRCGDQVFARIAKLLEAHPCLLEREHFKTLLRMCLFLQRGPDWVLIDDPDAFAQQYHQRLEDEAKSLSEEDIALADYGVFDLSVLREPRLDDEALYFFVYDRMSGVPYESTYRFSKGSAHYHPLPRLG